MGFLSSIFSGLGNLVKPLTNMFSGGGGGAGGGLMQGISSLFGGGQSQPSFAKPGGGAQNMMNSIGGANQAMPKQSGNFLQGLFPGGVGSGVAGMAIPAIGNMFAPKPKVPDLTQSQGYKNLQNFHPGNSVSPEYQTMIQNNVAKQRDQRKREIDATYHSLRPGTDYTTDSNYQRDISNLQQESQNNLTDELAKAEGTFSGQEQDRLAQLAQLDEAQIMMQTGLSFQEANDFKQMFSNVGNMFLTNATRKPGYDLSSLFGVK